METPWKVYKKLYNKTFHSPFFLARPAWVKGFWAVLIAEADEDGEVSLDSAAHTLRGLSTRPTMTEVRVCARSAMTLGMIALFEKNGATYVRLCNWNKYQGDSKKPKSPHPSIDVSRDGRGPHQSKSFRQIEKEEYLAEFEALQKSKKGNGNGLVH